jgi:hypothetical protein
MKSLTFSALLVASATLAHAAETYDIATVASGTQRTETTVVSEGHIVLHTISDYEMFDVDSGATPFSSATGVCFGAIEIVATIATGGGNCVFEDPDGDKLISAWKANGFGADGALVGTWNYTGGSGKFDGLSGGGKFSSLTDQATGKFRNTITGAARMP